MTENEGKVSVIVVYNDTTKMQKCKRYIESQSINAAVETIAIDNRNGAFSSAAKALNYGAAKAQNPVLVFIHQDLYLWDNAALEYYYNYLMLHPTEIAGAAGPCIADNQAYGVYGDLFEGEDRVQRISETNGAVLKAWSLDECMFAMQKSLWEQLRFDESVCYHWHLYAIEICFHNLTVGHQNAILPVNVWHESFGSGRNRNYELSLKKLVKKYSRKIEYIHAPGTELRCTTPSFYVYEIKRYIKQRLLKIKKKICGAN